MTSTNANFSIMILGNATFKNSCWGSIHQTIGFGIWIWTHFWRIPWRNQLKKFGNQLKNQETTQNKHYNGQW